jgi:hypothetical protein
LRTGGVDKSIARAPASVRLLSRAIVSDLSLRRSCDVQQRSPGAVPQSIAKRRFKKKAPQAWQPVGKRLTVKQGPLKKNGLEIDC